MLTFWQSSSCFSIESCISFCFGESGGLLCLANLVPSSLGLRIWSPHISLANLGHLFFSCESGNLSTLANVLCCESGHLSCLANVGSYSNIYVSECGSPSLAKLVLHLCQLICDICVASVGSLFCLANVVTSTCESGACCMLRGSCFFYFISITNQCPIKVHRI